MLICAYFEVTNENCDRNLVVKGMLSQESSPKEFLLGCLDRKLDARTDYYAAAWMRQTKRASLSLGTNSFVKMSPTRYSSVASQTQIGLEYFCNLNWRNFELLFENSLMT